MSRSRPYGTLLPPHKMLWLQQLWSCSYGLPRQKFRHQAHLPATGLDPVKGAGDLLPSITVKQVAHTMNTEDLGSAAHNPDPVTQAVGAAATTIPGGVNQGHSIGLLTAISHVIEAPAPITATMIHPTADSPPADMSPKTTADLAIEPQNSSINRPKVLHGI